jgi:RNA polymerase sigma-70 factor, ECF subfamily
MEEGATASEEAYERAWRANRPYLVDLAFAMLRDIGAAEDAVQEAFARLAAIGVDQVEDARGWLIVVTSRICLDQINSARWRHEQSQSPPALEGAAATGSRTAPVDPADRVTLDDQVRLALLVVVQRLRPAERVAFVLHDVFRIPFDTIAETLGRPAATCRQLARRAREKIAAEGAIGAERTPIGAEGEGEEDRRLAERFIEACSNGDLSALMELLDPDVSGEADLGPLGPSVDSIRRGADEVGRNLLRFFGPWATLVSNPVGGHSVILAFTDRRLSEVILLTSDRGKIRHIHVIVDPAKVGFLREQLSVV